MAKISLRMYNREIEGLVEQAQRLDEAIAHCRHILQTYPKHLETYRLLGKAYLEAKRYDQAVDIFKRVLMAAPEDFVSHVGMSIIADDKSRLDDAIWHMERAFEVQPSNAAIQNELQRLFGRRDGVEPPKIRLTRGALAHMYVQGELFNQAIAEIRAVLAGDPKRTDMQALLARAYFRNNQKTEAADICNQLLTKYPYCLDANRLMAEIAPTPANPQAGQEYRQRVIELDPYAAFATGSLFRADDVSDGQVTVERLEYAGETVEMPASLGIGLDTDETMMGRAASAPPAPVPAPQEHPQEHPQEQSASDLPAWLQTGGEAAASAATAAPSAPVEPDRNDLPEFLRKAGWETSSGEAEQPAAAPVEEQPQEPAANAAVEGDLPEWVKALAPTPEETAPSEPVPPAEAGDIFQSTSASLDQSIASDTPDWLRGLGDQEAGMAEAAAPETPQPAAESPSMPADAPDWLRDLGPVPSETAAETPPPAQPAEDLPDWLKDLSGRDLDEAPLKSEAPAEPLAAAPAEELTQPGLDETPDWLKDFDNDLETPIAKTAPPEPVAPPPAAAVPTPPPAAPETPGSLGSLGTTAQEQDDAMAWLEALAAKHGAKPEELVTDPNARTESAPEWVDKAKQIGEQAAETPAPAETTMPAEQPTQPVEPQAQPPAAQSPEPPSLDETGMWLRSLAEDVEKPQAPEPAAEQQQEQGFDLRSAFADQTGFAASEPEPAAEEPKEESFDLRSTFAEETEFKAAEPEPAAEEPPMMAEGMAGSMAESETPEWLKDLAETPAERTGMEDAPSWLRGLEEEGQAQPEAAPEQPVAAEAPVSDLPAWLADLEKEEASMEQAAPRKQAAEELPAWLQPDVEPEPEAKEPANPADWRPVAAPEPLHAEAKQPQVEKKPEMAAMQPPAPTPVTPASASAERPTVPAFEPLEPAQRAPEPTPAPEPVEGALEPTPAPEPKRAEKAPEPVTTPVKARPAVSVQPKQAVPSLTDAQFQLGRGNIAAALDIYSKLIRKGKSLEDIIRDLRDALYRYPVEVPLWQSLGDAYMRANRLQEALDAYTKAEELLR